MKKKFITLGVAFLILLGVFGLSGCDSKENIVATAMFSKNTLELPISGILDAPGHYYNVELSIDEIFSKINEDELLSITLIDDKIFIVNNNNDETKDYFIIREDYGVGGNGYYYQFFDMQGQVCASMSRQSLLIPYHLIVAPKYGYSALDVNKEYKTKFDSEEFFDFYYDSGWYDVEKSEDYILIKGYTTHEKTSKLNLVPLKIYFKSSDEPNTNLFYFTFQ